MFRKRCVRFVGICVENDVYLLMLYVDAFSGDFFNLKTGLAGMMLQKYINYHIRVAVILEHLRILQMLELGFRVYDTKEKLKLHRKNGIMHMVFIQW
ncbi:DUF4180 domain-containing protein [Bacillus sp. AFS018417]|uniref:DUF4180 domain-containing protein n=1 Tax=Bacillus sp. AFS018417 TaxID=2033491 RepID=UPI001C3F4BAD